MYTHQILITDAKIQKLTGTFFCVMTTAESLPRTPMEVIPPWLMALNAYSGGEKKKNSLVVTMTPWTSLPNQILSLTRLRWVRIYNLACLKHGSIHTSTNLTGADYCIHCFSFWRKAVCHSPTWYSLPSGEKMVMCLSNPALLPLAIFHCLHA